MTIEPLTKETFRTFITPESLAGIREAEKLGQLLERTVGEFRRSPVALLVFCKKLKPDAASPVQAVEQVFAELKDLRGSVQEFAKQWALIRGEILAETRFLRLAVIAIQEELGSELSNMAQKLKNEKARVKNKRNALIDVGVDAEEAARLTPEPDNTANEERTAAINAERALYAEFSRTMDGSVLPAYVHERAKQIESMDQNRAANARFANSQWVNA